MVSTNLFSKTEAKICLAVWFSSVLNSIYCFTVTSAKYFQSFPVTVEDFSPGWLIFNFRERDVADFEWETIVYILKNLYPVFYIYLVVSEIIRLVNVNKKALQCLQIIFTIYFLFYKVHFDMLLSVISQPMMFLACSRLHSKPFIWLGNIVSLLIAELYKRLITKESYLEKLGMDYHMSYIMVLLLCWQNLKCTSYFLSGNRGETIEEALNYFSYCFYFPTLFTGPFIPYEDFKKIHDKDRSVSLVDRIGTLALNSLRYMIWYLFVNVCLHFIYVNATTFQEKFIYSLDLCSLCGYGYLMGQFFHLKYLVIYGFSTSLAAFQNVLVPRLPRCIGRVHLYSDMWKHFDPGIHTFLKSHIYIPCQKLAKNKFLSSFMCFAYVVAWHGMEFYILIWAALNFFGVCLENIGTTFYINVLEKIEFFKKFDRDATRRFKCLTAAPLLAMSAISNFYFFAGTRVGNIFVEKAVNESFTNLLIVLSMLYCCCYVSMELKDVEACRMGMQRKIKKSANR